MITIRLTDKEADALLSILRKTIGNSTTCNRMLDTRTITPTYEEIMVAIEAASQINEAKQTEV